MPESTGQQAIRKIRWAVRRLWPDRSVDRVVQGVAMTLPWSHRLPDYAKAYPEYGQNLVRLASLLGSDDDAPLLVLDVGANVGDSTLQILNATDARVLCVEADAYFLEFLHGNVKGDTRVTVEASLLVPAADVLDQAMAPVRTGGTTRFEPGDSEQTARSLSTHALRERHPEFDGLRLVKSDTDGYDVVLVASIAATWSDTKPVLFFEYDHRLSRLAGNEPLALWSALAELGYSRVAVWDNIGRSLGQLGVNEAAAAASCLDEEDGIGAYDYWDVAVVHRDDEAGLGALNELVPDPLQTKS